MLQRLVLIAVLAAPSFAAEERAPVLPDAGLAALPALPASTLPSVTAVSENLAVVGPVVAANDSLASAPPAPAALAACAEHPFTAHARAHIARQLDAMSAAAGRNEAMMRSVAETAHFFLDQIDADIKSGEIDPTVDLRTHEGDAAKPAIGRTVRVGFYPVAADPFHWGHLLIGLQAMAKLKLDKVVFVPAGDDPRKPNMTPAAIRHPMAEHVLAGFGPLFAYSPIALGTNYDGETNLFRYLAANAAQDLNAFYLVGDDHYKLKDKNGNDDTIPKIEKNRDRPELAFDAGRHRVSLAFIEREGIAGRRVPTALEVQFLPNMPFEASSTKIRNGEAWLTPHDAYRWVRERGHDLYGFLAGL